MKHLLLVGGSSVHTGGVEAFCDRAKVALAHHGGWEVKHLPTDTAYFKARQLPQLVKNLFRMLRHRRRNPDCVWIQYGNFVDLAFVVVAKIVGMRVMVTPHLGVAWRSQVNPYLRSISGFILGLADRYALISITQEQEINLRDHVPRSMIRNFLPEKVLIAGLSPPKSKPTTLQLIHSGRLSEGKGSFMVVDVCARLRTAGVPFFARITGGADEDTYAELDRMIDDHDLRDSVVVLGRVPEDELLGHLLQSDVLVHLSRVDSYPLIVLEAIACSTLPLCLELAGARDQVETYGGHVVRQPRAVEEASNWLAAQNVEALRREAGMAATKVQADYAWARCASALDAALQACASGAGRSANPRDAVH